ncbi:MAG: helix-hairpin-helix domain-containing protein [Gemmatimonadota bacterium]|nr:helix-hairpin-helix domain-containing protein [Gemmatimonadota bacterium]
MPPTPPSFPVDLDEAGAEAIEKIPGIGPVLAARIVDDRRRRGPFGSLAGLQRVKGIGPGVAGRIDRYVRFSHPLAAPPVVTEFPRVRRRPKSP